MKIAKKMLFVIIALFLLAGSFSIYANPADSSETSARLKGRILLQVEQNGESWYVYPPTQTKFYLGRPTHAFDIMRNQGLGITTADLNKIPRYGIDDVGDINLQQRLSGYILLQVELNGEAWYVNPSNLMRYYLGRPTDAFDIMRNLGLGITDTDLNLIDTDDNSMDLITDDGNNNETGNNNNNDESESEEQTQDETSPVLTKFIVDFGAYDSETQTAGDFDFLNGREKVFGDFGRTVTGPSGDKILPTFDVFVSEGTAIESPMAGEISWVLYQEESEDYEIHMKTSSNNVWTITLDHIVEKSAYIVEGATVTAGQYLGKAAPWSGTYLTELMIYRDINGSATAFCPYDFFSSSLKSEFESNLDTLMSDWETFKSDTSIYDESGHVSPGCLMESEDA